MAAEDFARQVDDLALARLGADELVAVAGVEVLRVSLVGGGERMLRGDAPHLRLGQFAERERRLSELALREPVEEVALVLLLVCRAGDGEPAAGLDDPRVVSGGEAVERDAGFARETRQEPELQRGVAEDAGVGGLSAQGDFAEHPHDRALVFARAVDHLVADAERARELLGAGDVLRFAGTEARVPLAAAVGAAPELHGDADHLVPLLLQEERGDARVDAAGKPDRDLHRDLLAKCMGSHRSPQAISSPIDLTRRSRQPRQSSESSSVHGLPG